MHDMRRMGVFFSAATLALAALTGGAPPKADDVSAGMLLITSPWAPPGIGKQRIGVVYFSVRNMGSASDRLLEITLPGGGKAGLHETQTGDGVMRMRPVEAVEIPAGGELILKPGALHVMLTNLPAPLIAGQRLKLRLRFAQAGAAEIEAMIKPRPHTPPVRLQSGD